MGYKFKKQNCNICGSNDAIFIGRRQPLAFKLDEKNVCRVVRCRHCGLIYPDPMPVPDDEQIQENYSQVEKYFPESISERRFKFYESILNRIGGYAGGKVKLLDIGCGRGELVYLAKKRGWLAYGVDVSEEFIDYAKKRFALGSEVRVSRIEELDFKDEKFDAVSLIGVLQHTYNPAALLRKVNGVLKQGGIIFIEAMNNDGLVYKLGDFYYRLSGSKKTTNLSPTFPSYQIYGFGPKSMRLICNLSGFQIVKLVTLGGRGRTAEYNNRPFIEKIIRLLRDFLLIIAKWINMGQVLVVIAKKEASQEATQ